MPPATAAALIPGLCGVGAWLVLHRCCALLGSRWISATIIALAAASPLVVTHVNDSEVWGPHLLFSASFLYLALRVRASSSKPWLGPLVLGLVLGLAFSHHQTAILLVPVAIAAALPEHEPGEIQTWLRSTLRNGLLGILGSALGLLPYATLAIGSRGSWRWGEVQTFTGLVDHVLRRDYGTFSLGLHEEEVAATDTIARALASTGEVFSAGLVVHPALGIVVVLLALGLGAAWVHAHSDRLRLRLGIAIGWALALLASALLFPAAQNIDPSGAFGAWILERFDLLTVALLTVPLSLGLTWLGETLAQHTEDRPRPARLRRRRDRPRRLPRPARSPSSTKAALTSPAASNEPPATSSKALPSAPRPSPIPPSARSSSAPTITAASQSSTSRASSASARPRSTSTPNSSPTPGTAPSYASACRACPTSTSPCA